MRNIYKTIAQKATCAFIENEIISSEKKQVYEYGFEILISTFIYAVVYIVTSTFTKTILPSFMFLFGFFVVRTISGGYHANTYGTCHLLSLFNHIAFIVLFKSIVAKLMSLFSILALLLSAIIILMYAPIDHPNKPFIKTEKKRFRQLSCTYAIIIIIFSLSNFFVSTELLTNCIFSYSIGTLSASISIVAAKINIKKGQKKHERV